MPLEVVVHREALMNLGRTPAGGVFQYFVRLMAVVDRKAKQKLSGEYAMVRTGNLRSSQDTPTVQVVGDMIIGEAVNHASYAAAVHNGTRPHEIRPVNGNFLTGWTYQGSPVFTAVVHHPGTRERPWLRDSLREALAEAT